MHRGDNNNDNGDNARMTMATTQDNDDKATCVAMMTTVARWQWTILLVLGIYVLFL